MAVKKRVSKVVYDGVGISPSRADFFFFLIAFVAVPSIGRRCKMNKKKNLEMFACVRGAATCIDICIKSASLSPPWALTPKLRKSE